MFEKGKSGNPKGRPKGVQDRRVALRGLLEPHAKDLVQKAVELAKEGDTAAMRLCLERLIPPIKAKSEPTILEGLGGSLTSQGQAIIAAMGKGEISPDQTASMLQALAAQARISEIDELEKRISRLEEGR